MSQKVLTIVILQDRMTTVNDKYHLIQTGIQIRPYDCERNFLKIGDEIL